jgi:hypothetical protein
VGEWTVDPKDPLYSRSDSNALVLHSDGSQLKGVGPEGAQLRFWEEGSAVVGEATDVDGKIWKMRWQWLEPGTRARMAVTDGTESHEVTLIRPSAASDTAWPAPPVVVKTATPAPVVVNAARPAPAGEPPLFEVRGDLNSDGAMETVRIVGMVPGAKANSDADKRLEILGIDGDVLFESKIFQAPFRTDLDDIAETPEQKAGLHILESSEGYPVVRVIFVCRSGDFFDLQFDGQAYVVVQYGN